MMYSRLTACTFGFRGLSLVLLCGLVEVADKKNCYQNTLLA